MFISGQDCVGSFLEIIDKAVGMVRDTNQFRWLVMPLKILL